MTCTFLGSRFLTYLKNLAKNGMYNRAGELPKKFRPWVQTRHMGLKNVPKKFGTPGPNLAPNLFGLFGQGQITKAGTPK